MATTGTATRRSANERSDAPQYRIYLAEVTAVRRLGPSFVRLTFTGPQLREFGTAGSDQRIKILLPREGRTVDDVLLGADWYAAWKEMPNDIRPTMRTYTVRAYRPENAELDIDFVLHAGHGDSTADGGDQGHAGGPASTWAMAAQVGDRVGLVGPDRPGTGRMWGCEWSPPERADTYLLAGDSTAVPAIASIVESLPEHARGVACIEVPEFGDEQLWDGPPAFEVRWSVTGDEPHGTKLEASVEGALRELRGRGAAMDALVEELDTETTVLWEVPESTALDVEGGLYGWLAGEAQIIKRLRRKLVNTHGIPRTSVAFMGYWRQGHQ